MLLPGLGLYLQDIDLQSNSALWHIQRVLIICQIHFNQGLKQTLGGAFADQHQRDRFQSILWCSEVEFYHLLDLIISKELLLTEYVL